MPTGTFYYNLQTYNNTTDLTSVLFSTYIEEQSGIVSTSNMNIIDGAMAYLQEQITLSVNGATYISATAVSANTYAADGITSITAYTAGIGIALNINSANTGTCTLNINSLGARNLYKVNGAGVATTALIANDLIPNRIYFFIYNGTNWILIGNLTQSEFAEIAHAAASKTTPVDADETPLVDSASSNTLKKLTWANLKATLKTYFDTLYPYVANIGSTAETLGGSVANGTASTAARSDHKHAITNPALDTLAATTDITTLNATTSGHGLLLKATAPAAGLMNFVGLTNGETAYLNKPLFDTSNPENIGASGPGTQLIAARRDHVHKYSPRVQSVTDAATITPNADSNDAVDITAIAQTFTVANPTGTPVNFQQLLIRIKDNASPQTINWDTAFVAGGVALPTVTSSSKILNLTFRYNTANALNKWQLLALAQET